MPKSTELIWQQSYGKTLLKIGSTVFLAPFLFYAVVIFETKSVFSALVIFLLTIIPVLLTLTSGGINYRRASEKLKENFATERKANSTLSESDQKIWDKLEEDFNA